MNEGHIIQKIVFFGHYSQPSQLYYRGKATIDKNKISVKKGNSISFDTYFNMFSYKKINMYCDFYGLEYEIQISGECDISVFGIKEDSSEHLLVKEHKTGLLDEKINISLNEYVTDEISFLYLQINAYSDSVITSISLISYSKKKREVHLACGICTYKREKELFRNVECIKQCILDNKESNLYNHLDIFIANNGGTIDEYLTDMNDDSHLHVFKNPNFGGAAGFTRCLIEAVIKNPKKYDYIVLMDDDALIEPYVLEKTAYVLSILKEEYKESTIAGALLDIERMNVQVENGSIYTLKKPIKIKYGYDLKKREALVRNEDNEMGNMSPNYSCWYYSCIPTSLVNEKCLPLPIFIHGDDQEYGLRISKEIITLNGIGIWHPNPDSVVRPYMAYYDARNSMIINAEFNPDLSTLAALKLVARYVMVSLVLYRYEASMSALMGIEHFYKGVDYFKSIDAEKINKKIMSNYKYTMVKIDKDIEMLDFDKTSRGSRVKRRLLNWFIPATKGVAYYDGNTDTQSIDVYKRKAIYIVNKNKCTAYVFLKSYKRFFKVIGQLIKMEIRVLKRHKKVWSMWSNRISELQNIDFWDGYLRL